MSYVCRTIVTYDVTCDLCGDVNKGLFQPPNPRLRLPKSQKHIDLCFLCLGAAKDEDTKIPAKLRELDERLCSDG